MRARNKRSRLQLVAQHVQIHLVRLEDPAGTVLVEQGPEDRDRDENFEDVGRGLAGLDVRAFELRARDVEEAFVFLPFARVRKRV